MKNTIIFTTKLLFITRLVIINKFIELPRGKYMISFSLTSSYGTNIER